MPCPHLKEVVMVYCDAFPVKKMVPLDRLVSADPCLTQHFGRCPFYQRCAELAATSELTAEGDASPVEALARKEARS
jgi:hypothetical protein